MRNRVGLLGGTFNPIHLGHVDLGLQIQTVFGLDKVLYILSAKPPHKQRSDIVPAPTRWKMLNKALAPHPALSPCDIEMRRSTYSWTYLTLRELRREYPNDYFYFISGSEGFLKIKTWKNYKDLLQSLSFIVVLRKEDHKEKVEALLAEEGLTPRFEIERSVEKPSIYIYSYHSDKLFISSTLIRKKRSLSEEVDGLVSEDVKKIMLENKLYET